MKKLNPYVYTDQISSMKDKALIFEIDLPFPPSVNTAYSNAAKGRIKSKKYKTWEKEAHLMLLLSKRPKSPFKGNLAIIHSLYIPDKRLRDCANYEKVSTDILVSSGIIYDDNIIRWNLQQWIDWEPGRKEVNIRIYSL